MGLIDNLHESQVISLWQYLLNVKTELTTSSGEPVTVIYPGRPNDGQGADFRDAVIATSQGLVKGDIEVHVLSSDWRAHQHHRNPLYNQVVLHVVLRQDSQTVTQLQNGSSIPTVALDKFLANPSRLPPARNMPWSSQREGVTTDTAAAFLDRSGSKRFLAKAARFSGDITRYGPSQSLYQGIMQALGYSKNKLPFSKLASRLPVGLLESMTRRVVSEGRCLTSLQSLLLGTAGLLPSQRRYQCQHSGPDDTFVDNLERLWQSFHLSEAMSPDEWEVYRVRPANFPTRRIAAMSYLLFRYRGKGMLAEMVNAVADAPLTAGRHQLEAALVVATDSYWGSHFDLCSGVRIDNSFLLGRQRAADIVVNVLLPFTYAWSGLNSQPGLEQRTVDLYRHYPRLAINSLEQHMIKQLGLNGGLVNSARRQQGLIHIYNTLCTQGKCNCCPLGKGA